MEQTLEPPTRVAPVPPRPSPAVLPPKANRGPSLATRLKAMAGRALWPFLGIVTFLAAWEAIVRITGMSLPGPIGTFQGSSEYIFKPFFNRGANDMGLGWQILVSLQRVALGYALAALVGISLGVLVGKVRFLHRMVDPIFQVLRTVPPLAWLPIALAFLGKAYPSAIFVIFITALWPILINTAAGVTRMPVEYGQVAKVYQVRGLRYFFLILLPAAAPYIFTGLRISIGMAWLAIVAAEMLTGGIGIGFFIWDSWNSSRLSDIVVAVVYVGLVGFALDRLVAGAGKLILPTSADGD